MVVNFAKINYDERPILILKNAGGTPLGVLGNAFNIAPDIKYNELSSLSFTIPAYADEERTPLYDEVIGMRIVDLMDVGQFILTKPKEENEGTKKIKVCTAYSLEYELVRKKITIGEGTYKFFDDVNPENTLLGIMMSVIPNWSVGYVSPTLKNRYRTFEASSSNLYNFAKTTVQQSVNCIFYFDTYKRTVNVLDVDEEPVLVPVFLSTQNLAKRIEIEENVEDIATRVDVSGAEGVDIRDVNPCGTNQIINLDYYMTQSNFDASLIDKYYAWKTLVNDNRSSYYSANVQYTLKVMQKATESAVLTDLQGEYTALENVQAVTIQAIAQGVASQQDLDTANANLAAKQMEIDQKNAEIQSIQTEMDALFADIQAIRNACSFELYFTAEERKAMDPYLIDDEIAEASFVASETETYANDGSTSAINGVVISYSGGEISTITNAYGADIYDVRSGTISIGGVLSGNVISSVVEHKNDGSFISTAFISSIEYNQTKFPSGCITLTGSGCTADAEYGLNLTAEKATLYFTLNASEYEKRSVAWDLYEYGESVVSKVSQPSYSFKITSANFLSLEDFIAFRDNLRLGGKMLIEVGDDYSGQGDVVSINDISRETLDGIGDELLLLLTGAIEHAKVLKPILIGASFNYDNDEELTLSFSDSYVCGDAEFRLVDLLEKSVSMGRNLDVSKYVYSAFADSGASTGIRDFMTSALDVSKNAIVSSSDQAVTWDGAGLRLRKWANSEKTSYEDEQIWMNNNSIVMTQDNWATAQMAIGKFHDDNLGDCWGIVAPRIVGTLLAGGELVIESSKKDGGTAVFRVDGDGARLYNSEFSVMSGDTHITLNPDVGMVIGSYPVYTQDEESGKKTLNEENAKFWADADGNIHFKGTLHGANGEFTGYIKALHDDGSYFIVDGTSMGFYDAENSPMLFYENGIMTLYGAIQAKGADGSYFRVDGTHMGFYTGDGTPMLSYENGGLTLTGAVNATSLKIITNGTSSTIDTYLDDKINNSGLIVTDDHIIATVRESDEYQEDLSALKLTDDEIVMTVRNSTSYQGDLSAKANAGDVSVMQATLKIHAEQITSKVTEDEVTSMIEQSAKEIKVTAGQISLEGYTTINGNFSVDAYGTLTAKNGIFSGTLTAGNWTFNSAGAKYTVGSTYGRIYSDGSTMYYDTYGMHAQYGADSSNNTTIYGNYLKLVPATASCGILVCNSETQGLGVIDYEDPTLICDGAENADTGNWSGSCGNLGTRYFRWDIGWCKTLRTQDNYNDSSRTVKHNIKSLPDVGHIIDSLDPVSFVYNWDNDDKVSLGLIVEDTVDVLPEICRYDPDDPKDSAINYIMLVPVLLKEIQTLRKRLSDIEERV